MSHIPVPGTYLSSGENAVLEEGRLRACHVRFENMSFLTFSMVGRASGTNNCFSPGSHEIGTRMPTTCPAHEHLQFWLCILVSLGDELVRMEIWPCEGICQSYIVVHLRAEVIRTFIRVMSHRPTTSPFPERISREGPF